MSLVPTDSSNNPFPISFTRTARKISGEPYYLLEHENSMWINHDFSDLTNNPNSAWYTFNKREADDIVKFWSFIGVKLPIKVTEHIFIDEHIKS